MHAVTLRVSDASGNVNVTVVRVALRDSRAPNLTLHYVEPWDFERGPGWQDPMNVSAVDAVAGDVRSSVKRRAVVMTTGVPASICEGANQYYAAMTGQEGSSDNGLTGLVSASDMPEPGPVAAVNGWAVAGTEYRLEYSANDGNGNVAHEAAHMRIVDTRAPRLEVDDLVVAEYGVGSMFVDLVHPEPVDEPNQDLRGRLCAVAWRYELTAGLGERVSGNDAGVLVPVYAEARWREYARDPSAWESMAVPLAELTLDAMVGTLYRVSFEVLDIGVGTVWGVVAGVIVFLLLFVAFIKRRHKHPRTAPHSFTDTFNVLTFAENSTHSSWELERSRLFISNRITATPFGSLSTGYLEPMNKSHSGRCVPVLVNCLEAHSALRLRDAFMAEASILKRIGRDCHPSIASLVGVCFHSQPLYVVQEDCEQGFLATMLRDCRGSQN
ncbi:uncharacterized protein MONBRDRAFT_39391, partial [Monosiga brevicollis MX1]